MSKELPWYQRSPDRWRSGTRGMTFELRGFYSECLDALWDLQGQLPKDVHKLAVMLCGNPRSIRKLLPQLVALGKLVETSTGYYNTAMMLDILGLRELPVGGEFDANSTSIRREFNVNSSGIQREFAPNEPKNPEVSTRVFKIEIQKKSHIGEDARARDPEPPSSEKRRKGFTEEGFERPRQEPPASRSLTPEQSPEQAMRQALNPGYGVRPTSDGWELNGSTGVRFASGKLSIEDAGLAADLQQDFPGVDLAAVCNKAAIEVARSRKTHEVAMAAIRRAAQFALEDRARVAPSKTTKTAETAAFLALLDKPYEPRPKRLASVSTTTI